MSTSAAKSVTSVVFPLPAGAVTIDIFVVNPGKAIQVNDYAVWYLAVFSVPVFFAINYALVPWSSHIPRSIWDSWPKL